MVTMAKTSYLEQDRFLRKASNKELTDGAKGMFGSSTEYMDRLIEIMNQEFPEEQRAKKKKHGGWDFPGLSLDQVMMALSLSLSTEIIQRLEDGTLTKETMGRTEVP
jgi:hypothetical protein